MPSSDYSNAVGGGLKLKGVGGVDKKKKKKKAKKPTEENDNEQVAKEDTILEREADGEGQSTALQKALAEEDKIGSEEKDAAKEVSEYGKTEAQRRFEERRKKRLDERLKREGVQTHKERVQQLNKYLSTLSEHNDMPRIGPG